MVVVETFVFRLQAIIYALHIDCVCVCACVTGGKLYFISDTVIHDSVTCYFPLFIFPCLHVSRAVRAFTDR